MPTDLRERIKGVLAGYLCDKGDGTCHARECTCLRGVAADEILALPEIAEALAGRDAVLDALEIAHLYVKEAVDNDGGPDECEVGLRSDLDKVTAAIRAMKAAPAPAADAAAVRRAAVEQAAKAAADFVHHRLYRGGGDRAFPVCSFHVGEIYQHVLALADAPGGDDAS